MVENGSVRMDLPGVSSGWVKVLRLQKSSHFSGAATAVLGARAATALRGPRSDQDPRLLCLPLATWNRRKAELAQSGQAAGGRGLGRLTG